MIDNQPDPPSPPSTKTGVEPKRTTTPRPTGISILAILLIVGGIVAFGAQFLLFANLEALEESLRSVGIPPVLVVIGAMFLTILSLASGVGMWMATKWGWWLASFYYVYSIFRNGSALLMVFTMADQLEGGSRGPEYYVIKHGGRILIQFFLLLYFFRGNVLEYFGLETLNKGKAVGILVGVCVAITVASSAIGLVSN